MATPRYDIERVIKALRQKSSTDDGMGFDWRKLGLAAGICFNAVPTTRVMLGPLEKEEKVKTTAKKRKVRVDEEAEEEVSCNISTINSNAASNATSHSTRSLVTEPR